MYWIDYGIDKWKDLSKSFKTAHAFKLQPIGQVSPDYWVHTKKSVVNRFAKWINLWREEIRKKIEETPEEESALSDEYWFGIESYAREFEEEGGFIASYESLGRAMKFFNGDFAIWYKNILLKVPERNIIDLGYY